MISIYLVTAHSLIVRTMNMDTPGEIDHMIVLGAKVNGDVMSLSLYYRVREALQYLQENENTKVIVAGGQGKGEWITEAEAMASYFIKNDISEDRIIKEERSTTTLENIAFSRELIGEDVKELVIVTNDYHYIVHLLLQNDMILNRIR
ncbi:MAG: YdcF family protein [Bacillaceae bacterium]|nr:YdcF family protein [Bacillaceae bacterium]